MLVMNVVVVVCNALHLGFLGAYGNAWIETPNLDRLASEGVVFDNHFPENLTTLPTRRSWWTGLYGFPDPEAGWTPLRHDEVILPDLLFKQGIRSAFISDVPMLREAGQGFGRGFDDVIWIRGAGYDPWIPQGPEVRIENEPGLRLPEQEDPDFDLWKSRWEQFLRNRSALKSHPSDENTTTAKTISVAIDWLSKQTSSPFLLWLDLFSPHGPWDPPLPYRDQYAAAEPDEFEAGDVGDLSEEDTDVGLEDVRVLIDVPAGPVGDVINEAELLRLRRTYAGVVTQLDAQLGRLFEAMQSLGRFDDTLVIFTADQGEPLGEHGFVRRFRPWLYEELIHTPLMIRTPKGEFGGTRSPALVQTVDLLPTVLSALGALPAEAVHGHDLLPIVRGERHSVRDFACLGMDAEEFAIRTPEWHFILPVEVDPDDPPRGPQLFRKPDDRWEQNDVFHENPEIAEKLELTLRRFIDAIGKDDLESVKLAGES